MKNIRSLFWPSLALGGAGALLLFSVLDPVDFLFVGPLELRRKAGYLLGFLFCWGFAAAGLGLGRRLGRGRAHAAR